MGGGRGREVATAWADEPESELHDEAIAEVEVADLERSSQLYGWVLSFFAEEEGQYRHPHKRLCFALLVETIADLQRPEYDHRGEIDVVARRDRLRARHWLQGLIPDEETIPYHEVCEILFGPDSDADGIREAILNGADQGRFNIRELILWNS